MNEQRNKGGRPRKFNYDSALATALNLFMQHGYDALSISDLTREMGIAAPSLYGTFGNKADLYKKTLELYERRNETTNSLLLGHADIKSALSDWLTQIVINATRQGSPSGCIISCGMLYTSDDNGELADIHRDRRRAMMDRLEIMLEKAREKGELCPGADCRRLAQFFVTVIQGLAVQARDGATAKDLKSVVDQALESLPVPVLRQ